MQRHSRYLKPQHGCGLYARFTMKSRMFSSTAVVKWMDGTGANITHKEAKHRGRCQTHWSVCAGAEIFRGLKTVVAVRGHIHHRGDCCVCPEEGWVCVSGLQSYQPRWLVASLETQNRLDSPGARSRRSVPLRPAHIRTALYWGWCSAMTWMLIALIEESRLL